MPSDIAVLLVMYYNVVHDLFLYVYPYIFHQVLAKYSHTFSFLFLCANKISTTCGDSVLADGHIPWACEAFTKLYGHDLVQAPALKW